MKITSEVTGGSVVVLRAIKHEDLKYINHIYNDLLHNTTAVLESEAWSWEKRFSWFLAYKENYGIWVAERNGIVVGWASLVPYLCKKRYPYTGEDSVFVDRRMHRQGIGCQLLSHVLEEAQRRGLHTVVASIAAGNEASLALHAKFGYSQAGRLREVAHKNGRWLDLILMEKML